MIVGDPWLFELALDHPEAAKVAQVLLRTQARVAHRYGHILDFSEGNNRNAIKGYARRGTIPRTVVRCMRCGCVARLDMWVAWATMSHANRVRLVAEHYEAGTEKDIAYGEPCAGKNIAVETDQAIQLFIKERE